MISRLQPVLDTLLIKRGVIGYESVFQSRMVIDLTFGLGCGYSKR